MFPADPEQITAHGNYARSLIAAGRADEAVRYLDAIAAQHPGEATMLFVLGEAYHAERRLDAAAAAFASAAAKRPDWAAAHVHHGNTLWELGRRDEALDAFASALERQPRDTRLLVHVARLQRLAGRAVEARKLLESALTIDPENPDVRLPLANLLRASGHPDEALAHYERVIATQSGNAGAWFGLGECRRLASKLDGARDAFRKAISIRRPFPEAFNNLAVVCSALGRDEEALAHATEALAGKPDYPEAFCNKGVALNALGRYDKARDCYERALALDPGSAAAWGNLGNALAALGRVDDAIKAYRSALAIDPNLVDTRWVLTTVLLVHGRFADGWPEFEWRWRTENRYLRGCFTQPWWQGEPLTDRHLLVWSEQGIGDEVLFSSLVPDLISRAGRLTLECAPRLVPLLARSFPGVTVVARGDPPDTRAFDASVQSPLASTAVWLRKGFKDFPVQERYLHADAARVAQLRARYRALGEGPVIGLSWRSGNAKVGALRSIALSELAPALLRGNAVFVSLQYGDPRAEIADLESRFGLKVYVDREVNAVENLDGFAAQVEAMDLVISIDNATVHFAGALGRPVWALVPVGRALYWYWFLGRDTSPWYCSARLFRQHYSGRWEEVVSNVSAALSVLLEQNGPHG